MILSNSVIMPGVPDGLLKIVKYARTLEFEERPDYLHVI